MVLALVEVVVERFQLAVRVDVEVGRELGRDVVEAFVVGQLLGSFATLATLGVKGIAIAIITFISIPTITVLGKIAITTIANTTIGKDNIKSINL